jgi:hypothetical protein
MIKYVLFLFLFIYVLQKKPLIEGITRPCCSNSLLNFSSELVNETCVDQSTPKPIARCFHENVRGDDWSCDNCGEICPGLSETKCYPTLVKDDDDNIKNGGYCANPNCSSKPESECTSENNCKWESNRCKPIKKVYKGSEAEELETNIGDDFELNSRAYNEYKEYSQNKCNPFARNDISSDQDEDDFEEFEEELEETKTDKNSETVEIEPEGYGLFADYGYNFDFLTTENITIFIAFLTIICLVGSILYFGSDEIKYYWKMFELNFIRMKLFTPLNI